MKKQVWEKPRPKKLGKSKKLKGKNHVGKWDGSKFLFPGDDGFL